MSSEYVRLCEREGTKEREADEEKQREKIGEKEGGERKKVKREGARNTDMEVEREDSWKKKK